MADKQKLNEKIARWLGFKYVQCGDLGYTAYTPTSEPYHAEELVPPFTDSMDACIKWIVPELLKRGYYIDITLTAVNGKHVCIYMLDDKMPKYSSFEYEELATIFCLAVEKLIDSEINDLRSKA